MGSFTGTQFDDIIDIRNEPLTGEGVTAHGVTAGNGNDTVLGSPHTDYIQGEGGNDTLFGFLSNDVLVGGEGNDYLDGGGGDDLLSGESGADILIGRAGNDRMYGGSGDDRYYHGANDGVDTINDDLSPAEWPGFGGGNDTIIFTDVNLADLAYIRPEGSDDLWLSSAADFADGTFDDGVIVEDFFLGGNNMIETVGTADNYLIDLTQIA